MIVCIRVEVGPAERLAVAASADAAAGLCPSDRRASRAEVRDLLDEIIRKGLREVIVDTNLARFPCAGEDHDD